MATNTYIDIPSNLFRKITPFGNGGIDDFSFKSESSERIFIIPSSLKKTFALTMVNDISLKDKSIYFDDILNPLNFHFHKLDNN